MLLDAHDSDFSEDRVHPKHHANPPLICSLVGSIAACFEKRHGMRSAVCFIASS